MAERNRRFAFAGTTGPRAITFPMRLSLESFIAGSIQVVNNTNATLYVSRTIPTPTATNMTDSIPPRSAMAITDWLAPFIYVGSDGSTIAALDTVTVEARASADVPFSGVPFPVSLGSQIRLIQRDIIPHGVIPSGTGSQVDFVLATPVNPAKAVEHDEGVSATAGGTDGSYMHRLQLLNATTIRSVVINRTLSSVDTNHGFTLVEYV